MGVDLSFVENRLKIEKPLIKKRNYLKKEKKPPQTQLVLNFETSLQKKQSFFVNIFF